MAKPEIETKWLSINSYDVFRVIFGTLILVLDLYIYIKFYYDFKGKDTLGFVLTIMLVAGIALLTNGMDAWRKRDKHIQQVEKTKRDLELLKNKKKLKSLKEMSPEEYHAIYEDKK